MNFSLKAMNSLQGFEKSKQSDLLYFQKSFVIEVGYRLFGEIYQHYYDPWSLLR